MVVYMPNTGSYFLKIFCLIYFIYPSTVIASSDVAYLAVDKFYWQVFLMSGEGKNIKPISNSSYDKSSISWYPDGKYLLASGNQGELFKINIKTGKESPISLPFKHVNDAVISPDGKYIAFSQKPEGSIYNKLWLMNVKTQKKIKVGWRKGFQHEPVFSTDSKTLYYLSGDNDQSHDIMKYNIQSKSLDNLTVGTLYNLDVQPNLHGQIAFSSNRSGNYEIWVQTGFKLKKLTDHVAMDGRPSWSHDNKMIYFESNRSGVMNIWAVPVDGSQAPKQVTFSKEGARYPLWRPQ